MTDVITSVRTTLPPIKQQFSSRMLMGLPIFDILDSHYLGLRYDMHSKVISPHVVAIAIVSLSKTAGKRGRE